MQYTQYQTETVCVVDIYFDILPSSLIFPMEEKNVMNMFINIYSLLVILTQITYTLTTVQCSLQNVN